MPDVDDVWDDIGEYPDEFCEEISAEEEALQNCGMMRDGSCMDAGTEDCDWECPLGPLHNPKHWGLD